MLLDFRNEWSGEVKEYIMWIGRERKELRILVNQMNMNKQVKRDGYLYDDLMIENILVQLNWRFYIEKKRVVKLEG